MARKTTRVHPAGPLKPYEAGFRVMLADAGYAPLSARNQVELMRHLSAWLEERGLGADRLALGVVEEYLASRRADGYTCWLSPRGVGPLLTYLRGLGAAPVPATPVPTGPLEGLVGRYQRYLVTERGLEVSTVRRYQAHARVFLAGWVGESESRLAEMDAAQVTAFIMRHCARRNVNSAKDLATAVRSVLRFLMLEGEVTADLGGAVPAVAGWRGSHLPKGITAAKVEALLASCDRRQYAPGRRRAGSLPGESQQLDVRRLASRRNRAVVLLMVRLGLRAGEVARLRLDDLDWRRGEFVIRGKGRRDERLPLPADVGEAIVDYLRHGRPLVRDRALFTNVRASYLPMTPGAVKDMVQKTAGRDGIEGVSAHRLRHTAATRVLNAEAPMAEVGQLLRHRSASTTAIYAKVDHGRLGELAVAWPEVGR